MGQGGLLTSRTPRLLLHATPGALVTSDVVDHLRALASGLDIVHVGDASHFMPEDQPERIGRALSEWLRAHRPDPG